jgi:hypothetical protein
VEGHVLNRWGHDPITECSVPRILIRDNGFGQSYRISVDMEKEANRQGMVIHLHMYSRFCFLYGVHCVILLMDRFLMALRRLMRGRGTPSRIQPERCEQLVAASKPLEAWNFDRVLEWEERKKKKNRVTLGAHRWPTLKWGAQMDDWDTQGRNTEES